MKTKDHYLIATLAPIPVLLIPLVGNMVSKEWNWNPGSFVFAWVLLAGAVLAYQVLATRKAASFAYRAGAGLAVAAGFLLTWVSLAVQLIGDENPANPLYLGVILIGLIGTGLARFQPTGMAQAAFSTATATFLVPVLALSFWPSDSARG